MTDDLPIPYDPANDPRMERAVWGTAWRCKCGAESRKAWPVLGGAVCARFVAEDPILMDDAVDAAAAGHLRRTNDACRRGEKVCEITYVARKLGDA